MNWLIIEDSLENQMGHWFEYLEGFCRHLPGFGDSLTLLVSKSADSLVKKQLGGLPLLPGSVYLKMNDGAPLWRRYARIPVHAFRTLWAVRKYLKNSIPSPDVIFVPTVSIHHLFGWFFLLKFGMIPQDSRVLLFFPSLPIQKSKNSTVLDGSPSSRLMFWLLHLLKLEIDKGKVILGVETHAIKTAADEIFSASFTYFPHPVESRCISSPPSLPCSAALVMACYGSARYEKGSDVLVTAVEKYLHQFPESRTRFVIQWIKGFSMDSGEPFCLPEALQKNSKVEVINRYFENGEYAVQLNSTQVLLLPYRYSSYDLRLSRIVVEGLVNGIPLIVTQGTTLAHQSNEFGAVIHCRNEDADSLFKAIEEMECNYSTLVTIAREKKKFAQKYFSVEHFRSILFNL